MGKKYLYVPKSAKHLFKGAALEDLAPHIAMPMRRAYPVTASNANVVPAWAQQAAVPIPINDAAAHKLSNMGYSQNIVPIPYYPPQEEPRESFFSRVNFDALASIITKVLLEYMDGRARQNEPWYMKALRYPTEVANTVAANRAEGIPVNKENFLEKAAPVIGTIANSFVPGTGTAVQWGLKGLNWLKDKFKGGKLRKKKGKKKKSIFIFNDNTRKYLGQKVSFENDLNKVADDAFKNKAQDKRWRNILKSALTSAVKELAPAIGSGRLILGRKINKKQLKKMAKRKKGGSMKDYMAWVRSFKSKKRGRGLKARTSKGMRYINDSGSGNVTGAGKRRRKGRRHRKHGGKLKLYKSRGIYYPKPVKKRRKHRKKSGKGLVSSGYLMKGTPFDYSGMPPYF